MTLLNPKPQSFHQWGPMEKLNWTLQEAQLCGHGRGIWLDKHTAELQTGSLSARWWCYERQRQAVRFFYSEGGLDLQGTLCSQKHRRFCKGFFLNFVLFSLEFNRSRRRTFIHVDQARQQCHPQSLFIKNRPNYPAHSACLSYFRLQ